MKRPAISLVLMLATAPLFAGQSPVAAEMALTNLAKVNTKVIESQGWVVRKQAGSMSLFCAGCQQFTATDIVLEKEPDGTEARIRAGKTTAKSMLDQCRKSAKRLGGGACYAVQQIKLKGAVGFVSDSSLGPMGYAATYVLWQDGRRLTIRNAAPSRQAARQNGQVMFKALAPQIVR